MQDIFDDFIKQGRKSAEGFAKNSKALGESALTTVELVERAGRQLLAGQIDARAAEITARNGFDQLRTVARGESNLIEAEAGAWIDWIEGAVGTVFKLIGL